MKISAKFSYFQSIVIIQNLKKLQFDTIAYQKSGSVMMMIRGIIGDELWTQGRDYPSKTHKIAVLMKKVF